MPIEAASARQSHQPVKNQDDIDNASTASPTTRAPPSADVRKLCRREGLADGVHAYLQKFAFKNATAQDFIGTVAAVSTIPKLRRIQFLYRSAGHSEIERRLFLREGQQARSVTQGMYTQIGRQPVSAAGASRCVSRRRRKEELFDRGASAQSI